MQKCYKIWINALDDHFPAECLTGGQFVRKELKMTAYEVITNIVGGGQFAQPLTGFFECFFQYISLTQEKYGLLHLPGLIILITLRVDHK